MTKSESKVWKNDSLGCSSKRKAMLVGKKYPMRRLIRASERTVIAYLGVPDAIGESKSEKTFFYSLNCVPASDSLTDHHYFSVSFNGKMVVWYIGEMIE